MNCVSGVNLTLVLCHFASERRQSGVFAARNIGKSSSAPALTIRTLWALALVAHHCKVSSMQEARLPMMRLGRKHTPGRQRALCAPAVAMP